VLDEAEELLFVFAEAVPDPDVAPPAVVVAAADPPAVPPAEWAVAPPAVAAAV